jgi:hypothetical protein
MPRTGGGTRRGRTEHGFDRQSVQEFVRKKYAADLIRKARIDLDRNMRHSANAGGIPAPSGAKFHAAEIRWRAHGLEETPDSRGDQAPEHGFRFVAR